jgi:DNA-binding PadR family transcriptional regulator
MKSHMDVLAEIPLTETTYFILLSLSPRPKHGYAIMKEVQVLSDKRVSLSTGTLYGALKRLLDQGWIKRSDDPEGAAHKRKVYTLTKHGQRVLKAEIAGLQNLVSGAKLRVAEEYGG